MTKFILLIALIFYVVTPALAQSSYPVPTRTPVRTLQPLTQRNEEKRPRLNQAVRSTFTDQSAITEGGEYIYVRSGSSVPLPLTNGASLALRLESSLNTSGMNGVEMSRDIPLRQPILTSYAQVIAPKDILVETRIVGRGAGFKNRAELVIEPQTLFVDIDSYLLAGESGGRRVFLKPGKWAIRLYCSILSIENPNGRSWYAKSGNEDGIQGGRFGFSSNSQSTDDHYSGLLYLNPYGPIAYGITQIKGLIGFIFKRPNIRLPERTEINYRIDRMEATYLSPPIPKGPAKITYQ
jgi:hypothetical protein